MSDLVFYFFAILTVFSALMVPCSRNPINGAMYMIVSFVGTAVLFGTLSAFFLAVVQVLVYAGAVMVLFLFIIMLLNVDKVKQLPLEPKAIAASGLAFLGMVAAVVYLFVLDQGGPFPELPGAANGTAIKHFGYELFGKYQLPVQICGFLLLISMVGVIAISKKPSTVSPDVQEKKEVAET